MSLAARPSQPLTALLPSDEAILRDLARYYFLSAYQVCRLHYSIGSLTYVQAKLKRLTDAGFCQRIWLPRPSPRGSAPSIYALGRKAYFTCAHSESKSQHAPEPRSIGNTRISSCPTPLP